MLIKHFEMRKCKSLFLCALVISLFASCATDDTEKYQEKGTRIEDVSKYVIAINTGNDIILGRSSRAYITGDYLVFSDYSSGDKKVHLYGKNSLKYIASIGNTGQGPGEIISLGNVFVNGDGNKLYVTDFGHMCIYGYDTDSLIADSDYMPITKYRIDKSLFPIDYVYVSDTLCYGTFIQSMENKTVKRTTGKWNMQTGEVKLMEYEHPDVNNKQTNIAYSRLHDTLVEGHGCADLISIFDGNLNLKYNVYGSDWDDGDGSKLNYYPLVAYKDYIIAAYSGSSYDDYILPTKLHVFKMNGDYVKTLETGLKIHFMSADEDNNRLFLSLDEEMQFGYLDLKGILG